MYKETWNYFKVPLLILQVHVYCILHCTGTYLSIGTCSRLVALYYEYTTVYQYCTCSINISLKQHHFQRKIWCCQMRKTKHNVESTQCANIYYSYLSKYVNKNSIKDEYIIWHAFTCIYVQRTSCTCTTYVLYYCTVNELKAYKYTSSVLVY